MRTVLLIMIFCVSVMAQEPAPDPCAASETRRAMAESRAAAAEAKLEARELHVEELQRETTRQKQSLAAEQKSSALLGASYEVALRQINDAQVLIESLTAQWDLLESKIKRANGRWNCRILHLGCIGER